MRKKAKTKTRSKLKATRAPKQGQLARTRQLVLDTTVEMLAARGYSSLTTEVPLIYWVAMS